MHKRNAFTLIELMIVVAIIGILATASIPKFVALIDKSKEGYTKGALSTIRSVISVYYADNEGRYPVDDLSSLLAQSKYIANISPAKLPGTPHMNSESIATGASTSAYITDAGGWAYINNPSDGAWGRFSVNCSHTDIKGEGWSVL